MCRVSLCVQVGSPFAGRLHPAMRAMVGCCINILPLRLRIGGLADVRELVQRVRSRALAAFGNAEPALPAIAAAVGRGGADDAPLYQVRCSKRVGVCNVGYWKYLMVAMRHEVDVRRAA